MGSLNQEFKAKKIFSYGLNNPRNGLTITFFLLVIIVLGPVGLSSDVFAQTESNQTAPESSKSQCPPNLIAVGKDCVPCPSGQKVEENKCVSIKCEQGQVLRGNECVSCPVGKKAEGNQCVDIKCGKNQVLKGNTCEDCEVGWTAKGNLCQKDVIICTDERLAMGYQNVAGKCIAPAIEAFIEASSTKGELPFTVKFTAKASGGSGSYLKYSWDFGDGTKSDTTSKTESHTFKTADTFPVFVTVLDQEGNKGKSESIPITVLQAVIPEDTSPKKDEMQSKENNEKLEIQSTSITIDTDKKSYQAGSKIIISGKVVPAVENQKVSLEIKDNKDQSILVKSIQTDNMGNFELEFSSTSNSQTGLYNIAANVVVNGENILQTSQFSIDEISQNNGDNNMMLYIIIGVAVVAVVIVVLMMKKRAMEKQIP